MQDLSAFDKCDKTSSPDPLYDLIVSLKSRPLLISLFSSILQSQTDDTNLKQKVKTQFSKFEDLDTTSVNPVQQIQTTQKDQISPQESITAIFKIPQSTVPLASFTPINFEIPTFTNLN